MIGPNVRPQLKVVAIFLSAKIALEFNPEVNSSLCYRYFDILYARLQKLIFLKPFQIKYAKTGNREAKPQKFILNLK